VVRVAEVHPASDWCASEPDEAGTMEGKPSKAWRRSSRHEGTRRPWRGRARVVTVRGPASYV